MVQTFVLVQTEVGRSSLVASALRDVSGVVSAEAVVGPYDVIVRAEGSDEAEVGDIIGRIQKIDAITRTLSCQVAENR
ncbi:Lrp/AsnC ligand binding domain-containing protein [Rhodococcoides yunnanense]|uniref:Lrp/AsnC ligand binding domain-containing protein n=1 Tax=Rhodococcoides yunnanense TaxID=278209 RepID=UPI000933005D|nr:Lrp/AsnC ligand binding domain-containing protein [Rhodococcus yunnanensis]